MNEKPACILPAAEESLEATFCRERHGTTTPRTTTEFLLRHKPRSTPHCASPGNAAGRNHESHWRKRHAH